jgi:hypothetical protein
MGSLCLVCFVCLFAEIRIFEWMEELASISSDHYSPTRNEKKSELFSNSLFDLVITTGGVSCDATTAKQQPF